MSNNEEIADDLEEEINYKDLLPNIENGLQKNGSLKKVIAYSFLYPNDCN